MVSEAVGPGSTLRAEREALGVTLREVSETLNLSIGIIQAIEADEYDRLPGTVFTRGYVRAYARLLDLEPGPLLARSPQRTDAANQRGLPPEVSLGYWLRRHPGLVLAVGAVLVALTVAVAAMWLWPHLHPAEGDLDAAESAFPGTDDLPWNAGPMRGAAAAPAGGGDGPDVFDDLEALTDNVLGLVSAASAGSPTIAPLASASPQAPAGPQRLTASGDDRLAMRFSADCLVQVRDAEGSELYSEVSRAGDDLELVGQGPLRILLGYAPGVQLAFNGEPVPLGPHTRNNVATLVLGQ
jgi:cytoskeleton protein RodZ